ncbi:MAG: family 10 glycosylhydrolase [Candidatus Nitrosotenuis sp.]
MQLRGVWCDASEAGKTSVEVDKFVNRLDAYGFNAVFPSFKRGDGFVYWPCQFCPELSFPGYEDFDLPTELLNACKKRGIQMHAWFIDYFDNPRGIAYQRHREWACLNAIGQPTNIEILRGQPFDAIWMCPARRPGYTDQWLIPLYKEFAERYPVDSIHHDYIRYPGDLAPDQYCFCDYCLEHIPVYCGYYSEIFPHESFYHELYDRPYLEAHWEQSPRVLPGNWDRLDRASKSRFLLEGSFFQGGRSDLDYFFYSYRTYYITEFARLAAEAVRTTNPSTKLSAAVFKNPVHSGRFIGQDWRQFSQYVDIIVPMDYRDHFPGSFETYLALLETTIQDQKRWAENFESLLIGVAINFLYKEEERLKIYPSEKLRKVVEVVRESQTDGVVLFCHSQINDYGLDSSIQSILG